MKILMVGNDRSVKGGITSVITQLLDHGWLQEGVSIDFIPTYIQKKMAKKSIFFAIAYFKIQRRLKTNRPDLVHIHMSYKGSFIRARLVQRLCKKMDVPVIVHMHGSEFNEWYCKCPPKKQSRIRMFLREVNTCVVLGEKWNRIIKAIEPQVHTVVMNNTVSIPSASTEWHSPMHFLFMGVLIPRKGVSDLINAIKLAEDKLGSGMFDLTIAGTGPMEGQLKSKTDLSQLTSIIKFNGWTSGSQKRELFEKSQALILPSYNEGLPVSILEAISFGLPIIATDVGDVSTAVHESENGYLVEPGDVDMLAKRIIQLVSNRSTFEKFSKNSKSIAINQFSDESYFRQMKILYSRVIATESSQR